MSWPVPEGITASFANVPTDSVATASFVFSDSGVVILTFHPVDPNNPGVATLYDSGNNALVALAAGGYAEYAIPRGGGTYYWKATLGAKLLAMTIPSSWR